MGAPLGEGNSIFLSMSPIWDAARAPTGHRAVTITTHTQVDAWWEALNAIRLNIRESAKRSTANDCSPRLNARSPLLSADCAHAARFPGDIRILYGAASGHGGRLSANVPVQKRGPRTGIGLTVRLVGDSIFPGQSTAGVTLGAMRVADDVRRHLPAPGARTFAAAPSPDQPVEIMQWRKFPRDRCACDSLVPARSALER
ncbi:MAG: hypothetical protein U0670_01020 [Anaerolineae bacterium]